jgi:hypothetical protein
MALMLESAFFVALIALGPISGISDRSITVGDTTVEFVGKSGQFKLYESSKGNDDFIKIKMEKLEEIDSSGKRVKSVPAFASMDFVWSEPELVDMDSSDDNVVNATMVMFSVSFNVESSNVDFSMKTWLFEQAGTVMNGNETIEVAQNALKFTVSIKNWPFEESSHRLKFGVDIKSDDDDEDDVERETVNDRGSAEQVKFSLGDFYLSAPTSAIVDGSLTNITSEIEVSSSKTELDWIFPSFTELEYDPVIGADYDSDNKSSASSTMSSKWLIMTIMMILCIRLN